MELDSVNQTARLTQERAQSVLNCLNVFKSRSAVPLKQFHMPQEPLKLFQWDRGPALELLECVQEQVRGPTETISEAPGAYGSCGGSDAAGAASYETASTLAPWPSPEVGVVTRHSPGPSHTGLPPNPHPVVRPFVSPGRSAPGTGF